MPTRNWLLPTLLATLSLNLAPAQELRVQPDQNHVIASRLAGAWVADVELSERLGAEPRADRFEFQPDPTVLAAVPQELAGHLAELRIWQAGHLLVRDGEDLERYPYLLTVAEGNPMVLTFRSTSGEELDDAESFLLSAVPAAKPESDLLFIGGDFNNEPFAAFRRAEADGE